MKKVFLGGLPKNFSDEQLREMFCSYGEITDYVVMKDPHTKESRGFGFIEFSSEEPVNQIIKNRPHMIDKREIEVRRAMPKEITHATIHERTKRVFIGGLNYDVTDDNLRDYYNEKFGKYGRVESVEVKRDRATNHSRGFAFITFDSEDTVDAVLILEPKPSHLGRNCEVKKSEPRRSEEVRRKSSRSRRRTPSSRRRHRHDDDYRAHSPLDDYDRPSRRRSYAADRRAPPISHEYNYYQPQYQPDRMYERRSPIYSRYPLGEQIPPNPYPPDPLYDRSYGYPPHYPSYSYRYSPEGYGMASPPSSRPPPPQPPGSSVTQPPPSLPGSNAYDPRWAPPQSYNPRPYDVAFRDRDTNPYL